MFFRFISYGSEIHLVEAEKRQRKPRSNEYRNAWNLISQFSTLWTQPAIALEPVSIELQENDLAIANPLS
jgi:hypothetical protein